MLAEYSVSNLDFMSKPGDAVAAVVAEAGNDSNAAVGVAACEVAAAAAAVAAAVGKASCAHVAAVAA